MKTFAAWTNHRSEMRYCDFALRHSLLLPTPPPSLFSPTTASARRFRSPSNTATSKLGGEQQPDIRRDHFIHPLRPSL